MFVNKWVPATTTLLQPIERLFEFIVQNFPITTKYLKAFRLLDVYHMVNLGVQVRSLEVHLMYSEAFVRSDLHQGSQGCELGRRGKGLSVVDILGLRVALKVVPNEG